MSFIKTSGLALAASLALSTIVDATEQSKLVLAATAESTDLGGGAKALTYWVDGADGRHVVTTVDTIIPDGSDTDTGRHVIVRFSGTLLPGQTQVVSVPGGVGTGPRELQIHSAGEKIEITHVAPLGNGVREIMSVN